MNHQRIYDALIADAQRAPPSDYIERHHIIPRCLGGSDKPDNLIDLSARQHFVAHLLLAKIHGGKMIYAAWRMSQDGKHGARRYEWLRKDFSAQKSLEMQGNTYGAALSGIKRSAETRRKMTKPKSPEHRAKIASRMRDNHPTRGKPPHNKGKKASPESIAKMLATRKANGSYISAEYRAKMSQLKIDLYQRMA